MKQNTIIYEPTIGLEIHVELKTRTKMFCDSPNDPDEKHPNLNICPVCMGHPGTLPVINQEAIQKLIKVGLALNCEIAEFSKFDRKNYFYPDLPKGYQISQYQTPLCLKGFLEISTKSGTTQSSNFQFPISNSESNPNPKILNYKKKIRIERIHIEEDTGRLQHSPDGKYSFVDFNRAGVPLMELVTHPDLKSGNEIEEFAKELRLILRYLDASDADMEKGQLRIEVNISLRPKIPNSQPLISGGKLGTKVEIKNINSIKAAASAADYEIKRQTEVLESGGKVIQETRGWDENKQKTFSQRVKEGSADYRYFPEPDLPPLRFGKNEIEEIGLGLPELPAKRRKRFKEQYGITDSQVEIFTVAKHLGDYYERVASELDEAVKDEHFAKGLKGEEPTSERHIPAKLHALAANYIITEFPPLMNAVGLEIDDMGGFKIDPEAFAELMVMIFHQKLSSTAAKTVLKRMAEIGLHPEIIVRELGLEQVSETGELEKTVYEVIEKNSKAAKDYKNGKIESLTYLIGQVMASTKGRANPQIVSQILKKKLGHH